MAISSSCIINLRIVKFELQKLQLIQNYMKADVELYLNTTLTQHILTKRTKKLTTITVKG